jgi:hypothetical protein
MCSAHYAYARRVQGLGLKAPTPCSVPECSGKHDAKGFCAFHYRAWRAKGDPLSPPRRAPAGSGWVQRGYRIATVNGERKPEHVIVAERALGRPLPPGAVVHHIDENRQNNAPTNLVICPSNKYHRLIHQRLDAFKASGYWHWRKCPYCRTYDDPANMSAQKCGKYEDRYVHPRCVAASRRAAYAKRSAECSNTTSVQPSA